MQIRASVLRMVVTKLRNLASEHFNGFDTAKCNCNLTPSIDPKTGVLRKPSPIRYAYLMEDDLGQLFEDLQFSDDSFKNFNQLLEFTGICLTSFGPQASKAFLRSIKKELKLTNQDIKDLLDYRKQVIKLEQQSAVDVELSNEGKQESIEILKRPSLLYDYGEFIRRLGVVGEKRNIRIILLALTSRLTDTPISLVIKAESASGKSWLLKNCLKVMPEESYFEYTSMSNRALIYSEKDFAHKFIIFLEYSGQEDDEVNYLTRTLQSEGRLKYEYTAKVDGDFVTHSIDKPGPTGFITTTTQSQIFDENETRIFSLYINESQEQTTQIVAKLGSQYESGTYEVAESEIEAWRNIQRVLKSMPVQIPYAGWLAKYIPTKKVRVRRDFERVLVSISVCALLHQIGYLISTDWDWCRRRFPPSSRSGTLRFRQDRATLPKPPWADARPKGKYPRCRRTSHPGSSPARAWETPATRPARRTPARHCRRTARRRQSRGPSRSRPPHGPRYQASRHRPDGSRRQGRGKSGCRHWRGRVPA